MGEEDKVVEPRRNDLATDLYIGGIAGIAGAIIIGLSCGIYYAHTYLHLAALECCLFSTLVNVLFSKPLLITGAVGGTLVGGTVYLVSKRLRGSTVTR